MSSPTDRFRFLKNKTWSLKQVEKPHGKLANFAHSTELMKSFKFNLLQLLNKLQGQESVKIIPEALKKNIWVWEKCIADSRHGFPNRGFVDEPPNFPTTIISDAVGATLEWIDGKSINKISQITRELLQFHTKEDKL